MQRLVTFLCRSTLLAAQIAAMFHSKTVLDSQICSMVAAIDRRDESPESHFLLSTHLRGHYLVSEHVFDRKERFESHSGSRLQVMDQRLCSILPMRY